jgi:GH24 family phage-related lysozyme (muramidase)
MADKATPKVMEPIFLSPKDYKPTTPFIPPLSTEGYDYNTSIKNIVPRGTEDRKISAIQQASEIGRRYERFIPRLYLDNQGVPTIGYGQTENIPSGKMTEPQAFQWMLNKYSKNHKELLDYPTYRAANENVRGAILDLSYNIGTNFNADNRTDLAKYMSDPIYTPQVIQLMGAYRRGSKTKEDHLGLERRRADDIRLALTPDDVQYFPYYMDAIKRK